MISALAQGALDSYYCHKKTKTDYEGKVNRLKSAYKELHSVYKQFKSARKGTMNIFDADGSWRGERYKDFCNSGDELESLLKAYEDQLDAAQDAINTERANLEAKIKEETMLLGVLWAKYEELKSEAENLANDYL